MVGEKRKALTAPSKHISTSRGADTKDAKVRDGGRRVFDGIDTLPMRSPLSHFQVGDAEAVAIDLPVQNTLAHRN